MSANLRVVRKPRPPDGPAGAQLTSADILRGLHARNPAAERRLLDAYAGLVERMLFRILGDVRSLEDLVQDVFARVFSRIDDVREPEALKAFITSVTVFVAREALRKKRRHRWLAFFASDEMPEVAASADPEARQGVRAFYRALETLDADDRLAFTLRIVEGQELTEVASACKVSLATVKRRIQRAELAFVERCKKDEVLSTWLAEGDRWT
ncbi:RNA polymerase sigma factor [Sorangium atrum]|uniref:RNA polymerase sigma factor n=1 Tax=Sorangium atrum TaxID=2995308 RepID=A0ABT5CJF8_9BACT|nr:RNA polymerase sigma factor [Sorangium aterium]MDC0685778.1 RNA polymerase sigma factor [Sorangium aterium]